MCGIAGFVSSNGPVRDGERILQQFERGLYHRGPDDQGSVLAAEGRVGFSAARLAILDLSAAGHQPMRSQDGRHVIAFNGEVYNFRSLRQELEAAGVTFRSHSDTEVVLELYRRDGAACVDRLRGMFALAIWSEADARCFLARDPLGIKPLYYYADQAAGLLAFASELKPLLGSGLVPKRLNGRAVQGYFRTGSVPEPETLIEGVRCLEAGGSMLWSRGAVVERKKYWELKFPEAGSRKYEVETGSERAAAIVRAALLDSIDHHFVSDVPVGLFLSGGIDSTALLALARASGRENLRTFSVGVPDLALDESGVAARTARHFATEHEVLELNGARAKELFGTFLERMDQPSVDGFNTFVVSHFARASGMKVVLSGLGGDEVFGGYATFTRVPEMVRWSRRLQPIAPLRSAAGALLARYAPRPQLRRLGEFLTQHPTMNAAYASYRGIFTAAEAHALTRGVIGPRAETDDADAGSPHAQNAADAVSAMELTRYMRNQLLRDSDVMSMANSLELRVPFVDRTFIERVGQLPAELRLQPGKKLLLEAVPEIPEWVASAPKRGFRFPFEQWIDEFTSDAPGPNEASVRLDTWYQKWTVFVLRRWIAQTL